MAAYRCKPQSRQRPYQHALQRASVYAATPYNLITFSLDIRRRCRRRRRSLPDLDALEKNEIRRRRIEAEEDLSPVIVNVSACNRWWVRILGSIDSLDQIEPHEG